MTDRILLANMRFQGRHGVYEHEQSTPQPFEVDVELLTALQPAGIDDDLEQTIDYGKVYRVVQQIVESRSYRLLEALAEARRDRTRPLPDRLYDMAAAHVLCLLDEVEGSAAHLEVDALPPRLRAPIVAKRDRYERGVRAIVADGIKRRELRTTDATVATRAFLGALNWTAHWFRPEGPHSPHDVAVLVADYAVAGLTSHASKRPSRADRQRRTDRGRVRAVQNAPRGAA